MCSPLKRFRNPVDIVASRPSAVRQRGILLGSTFVIPLPPSQPKPRRPVLLAHAHTHGPLRMRGDAFTVCSNV